MNDQNSLKNYRKWIKMCKKLGLLSAKMGDWEYSSEPKAPKLPKSKKKDDSTVEGLVHDPNAAMPSDSEMLFYSTEYYDQLRNSRKDPTPRN